MELIVRIKEQQALRYEDFTGRDDQPQRLAKMGFVLLHGASTIYAEVKRHVSSKTPRPAALSQRDTTAGR